MFSISRNLQMTQGVAHVLPFEVHRHTLFALELSNVYSKRWKEGLDMGALWTFILHGAEFVPPFALFWTAVKISVEVAVKQRVAGTVVHPFLPVVLQGGTPQQARVHSRPQPLEKEKKSSHNTVIREFVPLCAWLPYRGVNPTEPLDYKDIYR